MFNIKIFNQIANKIEITKHGYGELVVRYIVRADNKRNYIVVFEKGKAPKTIFPTGWLLHFLSQKTVILALKNAKKYDNTWWKSHGYAPTNIKNKYSQLDFLFDVLEDDLEKIAKILV